MRTIFGLVAALIPYVCAADLDAQTKRAIKGFPERELFVAV